ncbi:uncharacterized protein [Eucyclogobius newberryi]|uniref:uncharacterized protein n=1 Tax=Eucyclogobius newberryi TaxID=166745 RepID=UPI003B5972ED
MGTRVDSEVIILSDEDEPEEGEESVLIVEVEHGDNKNDILSCSALEEDLVVTFTRRPDLLPHARFDCPIQPFVATECELIAPLHNNQLICVQCFCYICDKLASLCEVWSTSGVCHCNSHKKSTFWHNQRNSCLLGGLQNFNLTLCEIDSHLRHAETLLQRFKEELSVKFSVYLSGKAADESTAQGQVFDYSPVHQFVSCFLDLAEKQDCRAGAIMQLGAAELFVRHYPCPRSVAFIGLSNVLCVQHVCTTEPHVLCCSRKNDVNEQTFRHSPKKLQSLPCVCLNGGTNYTETNNQLVVYCKEALVGSHKRRSRRYTTSSIPLASVALEPKKQRGRAAETPQPSLPSVRPEV